MLLNEATTEAAPPPTATLKTASPDGPPCRVTPNGMLPLSVKPLEGLLPLLPLNEASVVSVCTSA